jgi:hypothetical protein
MPRWQDSKPELLPGFFIQPEDRSEESGIAESIPNQVESRQ